MKTSPIWANILVSWPNVNTKEEAIAVCKLIGKYGSIVAAYMVMDKLSYEEAVLKAANNRFNSRDEEFRRKNSKTIEKHRSTGRAS
jgi:hypothetical protein